MKRLLRSLFRRARREDGSATIEFVVLFPVIIVLFGSTIEAGILAMRQGMLERSLDIVVRELRLGQVNPSTHAEVKRRICNTAGVIPDCTNALNVELFMVSMEDWKYPRRRIRCVDRDQQINPAVEFNPGGSNQLMVIRACAAVSPMIPTNGLGLRLPRINKTDYAIYSVTGLVVEPL